MTERVDHAAEARKHIDWAHEEQSVEGSWEYSVRDYALIAQAEATLALVEQQRIANKLAFYADFYPEQQQRLLEGHPDIAAALGIETGEDDA